MTWTIIKITKIDDHQKLSAPIRVAKLFAKTATVFAAESVSLYGNEVNTYIHTVVWWEIKDSQNDVAIDALIRYFCAD